MILGVTILTITTIGQGVSCLWLVFSAPYLIDPNYQSLPATQVLFQTRV